ncbi:hypothetical protein Tco_0489603 [Tanacetum coccineum]
MAKQVELNKKKGKGSGQGENRSVEQFNTARQNLFSQAATTSTARKVNTAEIKADNPQRALKNKGIVNSGCSRHMTGKNAYLAEYQECCTGLHEIVMAD